MQQTIMSNLPICGWNDLCEKCYWWLFIQHSIWSQLWYGKCYLLFVLQQGILHVRPIYWRDGSKVWNPSKRAFRLHPSKELWPTNRSPLQPARALDLQPKGSGLGEVQGGLPHLQEAERELSHKQIQHGRNRLEPEEIIFCLFCSFFALFCFVLFCFVLFC